MLCIVSRESQLYGNRNGRRVIVAATLAAMVWWFFLSHVRWLIGSGQPAAPPQAIELQVVELPPAPRTSETPQGNVRRDAVTASHAAPLAQRQPQVARSSAVHQAPRVLPLPHPAPDAQQGATAARQDAPITPGSKAAPAPSDDIAHHGAPSSAAGSPATVSQQARLLSQPLPEVPDDLRDQAFQAVAVARFAVHADGTFDVELVKPTQNPRLNQILLATLGQWRFFPAIENGRPVESHQDVRVHFNVN
ncbi:energy transducer TonB [Paraburkholderia sp. BL17N1]|uniref:energy transducer TonB n=1 Tax=Paraburkholderia sp. BL17N1 TaxID=1938798 RepID=UPI001F53E7B8|nr:energy transducer TonB [Paraburkholderia sp. BL17N1]